MDLLAIGPIAVVLGILIVVLVGWMMGTRLRMLLLGALFGGLGYYGFYAWGEAAAAAAWVVMVAFFFFAATTPTQRDH